MTLPKADCTTVCEEVMDRLRALGFKLDLENEDHSDVLDALSKVEFVKRK